MKAFPCEWSEYDPNLEWISMNPFDNKAEVFKGKHVSKSSTGMDLRDYFATHAPEYTKEWEQNHCREKGWSGEAQARATWNYQYADAMMKAREVK